MGKGGQYGLLSWNQLSIVEFLDPEVLIGMYVKDSGQLFTP